MSVVNLVYFGSGMVAIAVNFTVLFLKRTGFEGRELRGYLQVSAPTYFVATSWNRQGHIVTVMYSICITSPIRHISAKMAILAPKIMRHM
eukprot:scaffold9007_cov109-Skeletonema_marinoi.AAC.1